MPPEAATRSHILMMPLKYSPEDGIGIGLYLAREILQKENGYIKVESKQGEGSTFGIFLSKL